MIQIALMISLGGLVFSLALCVYRALRGPTVADRVVAVDAASVVIMGVVVTASMLLDEVQYLDYVLVLAVLSFVGTVSFAKYMKRGVIIERDHH